MCLMRSRCFLTQVDFQEPRQIEDEISDCKEKGEEEEEGRGEAGGGGRRQEMANCAYLVVRAIRCNKARRAIERRWSSDACRLGSSVRRSVTFHEGGPSSTERLSLSSYRSHSVSVADDRKLCQSIHQSNMGGCAERERWREEGGAWPQTVFSHCQLPAARVYLEHLNGPPGVCGPAAHH